MAWPWEAWRDLTATSPLRLARTVECSDSMETQWWSKQFLVDGKGQWPSRGFPGFGCRCTGCGGKIDRFESPVLRREFNVAGKIKRATLYVTARGFYEVHINGKKVGDELLAPGYTDYDARLQYQTYDVTRLLHRGENGIGAFIGYGWYAGHMNLYDLRCIYGYFPQFFAQLEIELTDGTR